VLDNPVLDNPVWAALTGPHAPLAERHGQAARYPGDVTPFAAVPDDRAWDDLARLAGPGGTASLAGDTVPPPDWEVVLDIPCVQLIGSDVDSADEPAAQRLGAGDVPEMLDLVARARPGPFLPRTVELGGYLGIRRGGALVALAGQRMRLPGYTEISAVCTDPAHRGQGLASRLILAVAAGIRARGDVPFLHAAVANTNAVRLYRGLGFRLRREIPFRLLRAPG
jgi:ribosomal protein S18 acetylase RimI-like enzyme